MKKINHSSTHSCGQIPQKEASIYLKFKDRQQGPVKGCFQRITGYWRVGTRSLPGGGGEGGGDQEI